MGRGGEPSAAAAKARLVTGKADVVPERCSGERPELDPVGQGQLAACWYPLDPADRLDEAPTAVV